MYRIKIVLLILGISLDHDIEVLYKQRLANFVKRTSTLQHPVLQTFNSECIFLNMLLYSMCVCAAFGELKISIMTAL